MNHVPWDMGAIALAIEAVLGPNSRPRHATTKTLCGRRVYLSDANLRSPVTCTECAREKQAEKTFVEVTRKALAA